MSIMKRNEFVDYCKKNAFESGDGFIFKPEWLNIIKNKDANYRDWFLDVIVAVGVFGIFLEDMPDKMKIDMEDVIDCLYNEIVSGDNPLRYRQGSFNMNEFMNEYDCFCDEVAEIKEEGGQR